MQRPTLTSTGQYIAWYARQAPETTAVVADESNVSYARLAVDLVQSVRALRATAVVPGSLVGLRIARRYDQLLLLLACEMVGATGTVLAAADLPDTDDIAGLCGLILSDAGPASHGAPKTIVIPPDWLARLSGSPVLAEHLSLLEADIPPDQIVRVVRTSGTTGRKKAMPMTHATQCTRIRRTTDRIAEEIRANPRMLCLYPLSVSTIYVRLIGVLWHGGTVFLTAVERVRDLVAAGAVNYAAFSVTDADWAVQRGSPPPAGHRMYVEVFGAAVPPALRDKLRDWLGFVVTNNYSSNETNTIAVVGDDAVGTLYPGVELRIVDDMGRELPPGEAGRIRVRTPAMVHSYFNDPALTATTFIDGWYQSSDFGMMPEPGKVILLGRADHMLNIGGVKLAPGPIEARLKAIDGVSDAAVMSVPGPTEVGLLLVAVEVADGWKPTDLAEPIGAVVGDYMPAFKIILSRRFPRTETGKIKRHELEAAYRRGAAGVSR